MNTLARFPAASRIIIESAVWFAKRIRIFRTEWRFAARRDPRRSGGGWRIGNEENTDRRCYWRMVIIDMWKHYSCLSLQEPLEKKKNYNINNELYYSVGFHSIESQSTLEYTVLVIIETAD